MTWFVTWLIAVELISFGALPLAVRLFRWLPDRGVIFAKPLGILVVGYVCWLLAVFGLIRFLQSTIVVVLLVLAAASWFKWGEETLKRLSGARNILIASEAMFLVSLAAAAFVRAHNPEIQGTEKPMDFAILNALYRTDVLPAEDPWMSGHSISYYYFGYYLIAVVAKLSAVPASVGYNLGVALVFALLLAESYSLAFNLISAVRPEWPRARGLFAALMGPVMVGLMGNLEIGAEVLAARGYSNEAFWKMLAIKGLEPAAHPDGWFPTSFWWWWRASRIIPNTKPDGINEFPYFSFLLGDLHPHFTALPWVLLVVAVSLAVILARAVGSRSAQVAGAGEAVTAERLAPIGEERPIPIAANWIGRVVVAIVLGFPLVGNSWDFPSYTALFWAAALVPLSAGGWARNRLVRVGRELALISLMSVALYAPFFLGFSSQTKGIGLSSDKTPLVSLLIIFGTVLFALVGFLGWRAWPRARTGRSFSWMLLAVGLLLILASARLGSSALILGVIVLAVAAYRQTQVRPATVDIESAASVFLFVLAALGLALVFVPEYVFLVDLFGTRMNTVFKFHYQAWLLLGLAGSVGTVWMASALRPLVLRVLVLAPLALLVGVGLLYPLGATYSKTQGFQTQATLDGFAYYRQIRPDDYAAIQWLARSVQGRPVVLEATGGEYTEYARVSTFSGLPTVLGWAGHEVQWRGTGEEPEQRTKDIDAIYSTANRSSVLALLAKYRVQYVFVGSLEIEKYGPGVAERFSSILQPVFRQGQVVVYRVAQQGTAARPTVGALSNQERPLEAQMTAGAGA